MVERYTREYTDHKSYYLKARDRSSFKNLYLFFLRDSAIKNSRKIPLEELAAMAQHVTLKDVDDNIGTYEQWRKVQGRKAGTVLKDLGLLRRMYNIARKQWKWRIPNPVSDIELPKVKNERVRYLTQQENRKLFEALQNAPEAWLKPVVITAMDTGLRLTNLCELSLTEVNLFSRMIIINGEKMKNDNYIGIPLTERAYQTLKEQLQAPCVAGRVFHEEGRPLYDRKVQRAFNKALKVAKIENFHFHDLRHTFASYLRQRGIDLHTIAVLMGHKDLRMTRRYAHLNADSLKSAIAVLDSTTILRQSAEKEKEVIGITS